MNRVKPEQLINLWVHMYDLNTLCSNLRPLIFKYDSMGPHWQDRVRNWRNLIHHEDIEYIQDDSPLA